MRLTPRDGRWGLAAKDGWALAVRFRRLQPIDPWVPVLTAIFCNKRSTRPSFELPRENPAALGDHYSGGRPWGGAGAGPGSSSQFLGEILSGADTLPQFKRSDFVCYHEADARTNSKMILS